MDQQAFCGSCGAARVPGAAFCASCGASFTAASPAAQPTIQQGLAGGLLELEKMRMKLIVGRLVGIALGLGLWWFVLGPAFNGDFIPTAVSLVVVLFGGLYLGQLAVLAQQRR